MLHRAATARPPDRLSASRASPTRSLADTNVLGNLATACTWMLAMLVWLVVLGGFLSVPSYGFLSFVIVPVLGVMIIPQAGTRDELHALGRRRGRRG